jgi:Protein of unknown function (DUF992)
VESRVYRVRVVDEEGHTDAVRPAKDTSAPSTSTKHRGPPIMSRISLMLATLALMTAISSQAIGQVPSGTKIGTLNCELAPSVGFLVGSHQPMRCRYTPEGPFPPEFYEGVINTIGLDIGFTTGGVMTWAVVAPTVGAPRGGLAGLYVGASGDVTAGVGVGANVLFGGSGRSIALQPLSLQGQTGLDLTLGVSGLELRPVR